MKASGATVIFWPRLSRSPAIPVRVVCGPPASGKSHYVREKAGPGDVVIDLDTILRETGGAPRGGGWGARQRALEERNRQERATDALTTVGQVSGAMDDAEQELDLGRPDALGNLAVLPATHKDYVQRWTQHWDRTTKQHLDGLRDPQTRRATENMLLRDRIHRESKAKAHATKLFFDNELAVIGEQERTLSQTAALDPSPAVRKDAEDRYVAFIELKRAGGVIGAAKAGELIAGFREKTAIAEAQQVIQRDPASFSVANYAGRITDPIKLGSLQRAATDGMERAEDRAHTQWNRKKEEAYDSWFRAIKAGG